MTIDELVAYVKQEAHDNTLTTSQVFNFIDKAIRYLEDRGEYDYQKIVKEEVNLSNGDTTIPLTHNLKRIIEIKDDNDVGLDESYYYISNTGVITLYDAVSEDTTYYVTYIRYSPEFDGTDTNFIIPSYMHRIIGVGAAFYAMMFNNVPDAQNKLQEFINMIDGMYKRDVFKSPFIYKRTDVKGI